MRHAHLLAAAMLAAALPLPAHAGKITELHSLKLDVPSTRMTFPEGPEADAANNNCIACHSADHVMNQPSLPKEAWEEVVHKMIEAYKAPISPDDAEAIAGYLTRIKGAK
ncbi:MAG: c-type cytochrome [Rhodomicrobium sp.]